MAGIVFLGAQRKWAHRLSSVVLEFTKGAGRSTNSFFIPVPRILRRRCTLLAHRVDAYTGIVTGWQFVILTDLRPEIPGAASPSPATGHEHEALILRQTEPGSGHGPPPADRFAG